MFTCRHVANGSNSDMQNYSSLLGVDKQYVSACSTVIKPEVNNKNHKASEKFMGLLLEKHMAS